jgi:hypothetical protein
MNENLCVCVCVCVNSECVCVYLHTRDILWSKEARQLRLKEGWHPSGKVRRKTDRQNVPNWEKSFLFLFLFSLFSTRDIFEGLPKLPLH